MIIETKDLPEVLFGVLKNLGYNRRDIEILQAESVSPLEGSGDGYRAFCCIIDMGTGESKTEWGSWGGANIFNQNNRVDLDRNTYNIPPNFAVIKGLSGGKTLSARIYVRPDQVIKCLPEKEELTEREKQILNVYARYNSMGRKSEFTRIGAPSKEEQESLVSKGLIKITKSRAVSLTTKGKNNAK